MERSSEVELLDRIHRGDDRAFGELVRGHGGYLYGVARALVRDEHEAHDVVQETFTAVLSSRFRGDSALRTWLVGIAVRQAAMARRKRRPWLRLWRPPEDESDPPAPVSEAGQAAVEARLDLTVLLDRLSPEHREVIVLRELEGMSYEEMASLLGVPRGTVESRLHRARQQLRQGIEGEP